MSTIDLTPITSSREFCGFLGVRPGADVEFQLLGHGEYNINYRFCHPLTGDMLVLRIPVGSQMHLANQVRYEFEALKLLERCGRTPTPHYIDDTKTVIPYGFLVMNHLPGQPLRYESDLETAARCLADIHNLEVPRDNHLLQPYDPLNAILEECHAMAQVYLDFDRAPSETKGLIKELLDKGRKIGMADVDSPRRCIVNTELNSGNFLVNDSPGKTFLVDWEKPLYAYPGQDLGHFLAPTTTFWKTDTILAGADIMAFVEGYCRYSTHCSDPDALWRETLPYFTMTCLRGITWCAMAWVEYQRPDRMLKDTVTEQKIRAYLTTDFLERIRSEYLDG